MSRSFLRFAGACLGYALLVLPAGCLKDKVTRTYSVSVPVLQTLSQVRASIQSVPAQPVEQPGKIYLFGKYILLNEPNKGIHVIDNSNPAAPKNAAFINIPGTHDLAVKGAVLYADSYADLIAFDLSDILHARLLKFVENVFPQYANYYRYSANPDSALVVTSWITKDTTVDAESGGGIMFYSYPNCANCMVLANASSTTNTGTGGSLARFTIVNDYLYTISYPDLKAFDIQTPADPQPASQQAVSWQIETIYPFGDKLFVGASNGMFMFDIAADPSTPKAAGEFTHVRSCDPVIADGKYAYVTLSSGTSCQGMTNELEVIDVSDMDNASLVKAYALNHPHGLSKDGSLLFICDDQDGFKIYDASDVLHLNLIKQFRGDTYLDVIALNGLAIVLTSTGITEYDYRDQNNIRLLSRM